MPYEIVGGIDRVQDELKGPTRYRGDETYCKRLDELVSDTLAVAPKRAKDRFSGCFRGCSLKRAVRAWPCLLPHSFDGENAVARCMEDAHMCANCGFICENARMPDSNLVPKVYGVSERGRQWNDR
ncbi:MAG: hypothetical protein LBI39_01795 [Puniceicoccales bacterium]|jgi:hypothetical protein|nr:hypothetical protein [Puniceicoccales bacterium]